MKLASPVPILPRGPRYPIFEDSGSKNHIPTLGPKGYRYDLLWALSLGEYWRFLVPNIPLMVFGTRVLKHWVLGPSGLTFASGPRVRASPLAGTWLKKTHTTLRVQST